MSWHLVALWSVHPLSPGLGASSQERTLGSVPLLRFTHPRAWKSPNPIELLPSTGFSKNGYFQLCGELLRACSYKCSMSRVCPHVNCGGKFEVWPERAREASLWTWARSKCICLGWPVALTYSPVGVCAAWDYCEQFSCCWLFEPWALVEG